MKTIKQLEKQRDQILEQMRNIRSMKRGSINQQYFPAIRGGKKTKELRGPYYVLSRKEGLKTVSCRLKGDAELQQAREDVVQYKQFMTLCKAFEELTERLGELQRQQGDLDREKKRRKSPSNKTRK